MNTTSLFSRLSRYSRALTGVAVCLGAAYIAQASPTNPSAGQQSRWALRVHLRLDDAGRQRPTDFEIHGDWISTVSQVRVGEYDAQLQLANPQFEQAATSGELARLSRPFWATYRSDGALLRVHFYKDLAASDRNFLEMIATETQLVQPKEQGPVWTELERDGAGMYLALYNHNHPDSIINKRKLKYVRVDGAAGVPADGLVVSVQQSDLSFMLDSEGDIASLEGHDQMGMGVPLGKVQQLTATMDTRLSGLRKTFQPDLVGSLSRSASKVETSAVGTHVGDVENERAQADARLLEGWTTKSLLQAATDGNSKEMLGDRLAALFRRKPDATAAALALLLDYGSNSRITNAMANSGSVVPMRGLAHLAADPTAPVRVRTDALLGLTLVRHPEADVMRLVLTLLDDSNPNVASAARMISGALARAGRTAHPDEADHIDADLGARYRRTTDVRVSTELIAGLGNSVGPSALAPIHEALRDPRPALRAAAARALRFAPPFDSDEVLSRVMTSDSEPNVRAAAIVSAGFRHTLGPHLAEALADVASHDKVDYVRTDAVALLRRNPHASPRVLQALAWVAKNDSLLAIRQLAGEGLNSPER